MRREGVQVLLQDDVDGGRRVAVPWARVLARLTLRLSLRVGLVVDICPRCFINPHYSVLQPTTCC